MQHFCKDLDNKVINLLSYVNCNGVLCKKHKIFKLYETHSPELIELTKEDINLLDKYMSSRYSDGVSSLYELFYRLINNIEQRPKCRCCGSYLTLNNTHAKYRNFCSLKCGTIYNKDIITAKNKEYLKKLRNDPEAFAKYVANKSKAGKTTWANMTPEQREELSKRTTAWNNEVWADPKQKASRSKHMKDKWDERKANMTEEEKKEFHDRLSKQSRDAWANKSKEEREEFKQKQRDAWANKSEEEKNAWWTNVVAAKEAKGINLFPNKHPNQETETFEYIQQFYPLAKHGYKTDPRYDRYECDIYVPEKDAFIECQYFKTHGRHPYDPNNPKDQEFVEYLKNNSFCHHDYKTFTIRDPKKRRITKERNMNFYEMWNCNQRNYDEVMAWLNSLPNVTQEEIDRKIEEFKKSKSKVA